MAGKRNRWGRLRGVERGVWEVRNKRSVNPEWGGCLELEGMELNGEVGLFRDRRSQRGTDCGMS